MAVLTAHLPTPGSSIDAWLIGELTATAKPDRSGWTAAWHLWIQAVNSAGFPNNAGVPPAIGTLHAGSADRVSFAGGYNVPSGHPWNATVPNIAGKVVDLGSGSTTVPVTPSGDLTWSDFTIAFNDSGSPEPFGDASAGPGTLVFPHITRSLVSYGVDDEWALHEPRFGINGVWVPVVARIGVDDAWTELDPTP